MNREQLRARTLELLTGVAPDVDPASVIASVPFRDQFDFDSMDQLNFAIALHQALGVDIPELDYPELASLDRTLAYLEPRLPAD